MNQDNSESVSSSDMRSKNSSKMLYILIFIRKGNSNGVSYSHYMKQDNSANGSSSLPMRIRTTSKVYHLLMLDRTSPKMFRIFKWVAGTLLKCLIFSYENQDSSESISSFHKRIAGQIRMFYLHRWEAGQLRNCFIFSYEKQIHSKELYTQNRIRTTPKEFYFLIWE